MKFDLNRHCQSKKEKNKNTIFCHSMFCSKFWTFSNGEKVHFQKRMWTYFLKEPSFKIRRELSKIPNSSACLWVHLFVPQFDQDMDGQDLFKSSIFRVDDLPNPKAISNSMNVRVRKLVVFIVLSMFQNSEFEFPRKFTDLYINEIPWKSRTAVSFMRH